MIPLRWRIVRVLKHVPGQCLVDLALWATRATPRTSPWSPKSGGCQAMCTTDGCRDMAARIAAEPEPKR